MDKKKDREAYDTDGYRLIEGLVPAAAVAAVRQRVLQMLEEQPEWAVASWQVMDPGRATNDKGQPLPVGIQRPARYEAVFEQVARHPRLIEAMAALLGGEVELFTDQIGIKHGFLTEEQGGRSYYHQDSYYWKIDPALGANCWIPLDEVDVDAIALGVKPGSQSGWQLQPHENYLDDPAMGGMAEGEFRAFKRHRVPLDDIDYSDEVVVPMQPGDGLFFSNYTWHRSEPNRSGQTRMFYAVAYQLTAAAIERKEAARP